MRVDLRFLGVVTCVWICGLAESRGQTARLQTRWTAAALAEQLPVEYPRPQLVRPLWQHLNGSWQFALRPVSETTPPLEAAFQGTIRVPYPIESLLSGVGQTVEPDQALWYRRVFRVPADWPDARVALHFGAVDWHATVWVDGQQIGEHRGGYDPFWFDISPALRDRREHVLVVKVLDPTDTGTQPRGKQVRRPEGIWYTPTTGIWQTVWLEPLPATSLESVRAVADLQAGSVRIDVSTVGARGNETVRVAALDAGREVAAGAMSAASDSLTLTIPQPHLWSPADPHLYDLKIELWDGERRLDSATSYFALREIRVGFDDRGTPRLLLNNTPLFQYGLLDQGFWPDGLYAAPGDEALRYDLEVTKRFGFNMVRKHVKVEPARWYYHCDRLGLLVWQDMPSGDRYIGATDPDIERTAESVRQFEEEWREIIQDFSAFACIVMWVPFNEGWGQFETARIAAWTKQLDPTRLVNSASGWTDRGVGDVHDVHIYPGPGMPPASESRAAVLGEFGGLGLPLEGHTWQAQDNWGYRSFQTAEELNANYLQLVTRLRPLIARGLCAAIYTQTTDVEIEVNGIMTYDRAVLKLDESAVRKAHERLFLPPPIVTDILPTSQTSPQTWRYTTARPPSDWPEAGFDDAAWPQGQGGFGTDGTPGAVVRTNWDTADIWLRRSMELPAGSSEDWHLLVHHDEDAEIYVDGELLAQVTGYSTDYELVELTAESRKRLTPGRHLLAVHCRQTRGGQFIDVGMVHVTELDPSQGKK